MSEIVKRNYESALRAEQAKATRRAIVDAAARLFVERGYGPTTVDAIAKAAGVSRKTVFTSVGGKLQALKLARDWAIVGDDEPIPLMARPQVKQAQAEPDARQILRMHAAMVRDVNSRVAQIVHVIESAAGLDADIRALSDEGRAQRQTGMRALAAELQRRAALRPDLDADLAADILCVYNDSRVYRHLVHERGWSPERFEQWLAEALTAQLIRPDYAANS
jgi:AcrR family transcriptional regulator